MKPVIRYQSQLLFRKSYKPNRVIRVQPDPKAMRNRPQVFWRSDSFAIDILRVRHPASRPRHDLAA
jgi:hypothetical protein